MMPLDLDRTCPDSIGSASTGERPGGCLLFFPNVCALFSSNYWLRRALKISFVLVPTTSQMIRVVNFVWHSKMIEKLVVWSIEMTKAAKGVALCEFVVVGLVWRDESWMLTFNILVL